MRKRRLGWIALTLGWTLAHADEPLDQPVRYDQPARTVKQLLDDLSRQTGTTLFAPSPLDAEIVLVAVQNMPLKKLMEHLATVTDGEWFKQPNGSYHLVRTPKLARERREQDNEQILQKLQRLLRRKELEPLLEPLTEEKVRQSCEQIKHLMQEIEAQEIRNYWSHPLVHSLQTQGDQLDVGSRLIIRLVRQLDWRRLLEIPVGERRVFSNVQGRYLLPLGFEVKSLLEQYQREARLVHQVWTHPIHGIDAQRVEKFNERYGYVVQDYKQRREPPRSPLTRLYLVVRRDGADWFSFRITLVSEDLKEGVGAFFDWTQLVGEEESEGEKSGSGSKPSQSEASQKPVARAEWSALSRQFIEAYRAVERTEEPIAFPDVLDPAKVEPLSLVPTDVLRAYARQKGKPVVALVPDDFAWWLVSAVRGSDTLQEYERWFRWSVEMREREGVLLFKPRWASYSWGRRADRLAISRWLRQLHQRGYPKLEDYLAMLQMQERLGFEDTILWVYKGLILPDAGGLNDNLNLYFLNRLSAKQLDHLRVGGKLTLRELSPVQREQLLRDIYFGSSRLERVYSASEQLTPPFEHEEQETMEVSLPHVFYPDGLPADLTIQLAGDPGEEVGVFTTRRAGVWGGFRNLSSLALEIHLAEEPSEGDSVGYNEYISRVRMRANRYKTALLMPVRSKPLRLEIRLGGRRAVHLPSGYGRGLPDFELLNEGKAVTLDTLPDELKTEFEKYLKWFKEQKAEPD
jgi:hypothetical protein